MQTMYCNQGGAWQCPDWVTYSILYPGSHNPYSRSAEPTPLVGPESGLTTEQATKQAEILAGEDILELRAAVDAGDKQVAFSFEELPTQIPAP